MLPSSQRWERDDQMKSMNCQNVKYVGVLVILYLPNEKLVFDAKIYVATSCTYNVMKELLLFLFMNVMLLLLLTTDIVVLR